MNFIASILVKPTIILSFAVFFCLACKKASASARCAVLALAIVCALVMPITELVLPSVDLPLMTATQPSMMVTPPETPSLAAENAFDASSQTQSTIDARAQEPISQWTGNRVTAVLPLVWLVGFAAVLARLLLGVRAAQRLAKNAITPDEDWNQLLIDLQSQLSVMQSVRVAIANGALSPVTWGLRTSVIVLPAQCAKWPAALRRVVLTHELAHVKRRDLALQIMAQGACALYWFNPLFWYAASRLRIEREQACDDYVLNFGANPSDYAANLLQIARAGAADHVSGAAIAMAHYSHLETRLRAIMANRNRQTLSRLAAASLLCAAGLLTTAIATIQLTALPAMPPTLVFERTPLQALATPPEKAIVPPQAATTMQPLPPPNRVPQRLRFEVASIKQTTESGGVNGACRAITTKIGANDQRSSVPVGRCVFRRARLSNLIANAYLVPPQLLKGGPDWIKTGDDRYDVEAKAENPETATEEQLVQMLQSLLADRFKLRFHKETAPVPGFALVVDAGGPKFAPARNDEEEMFVFSGNTPEGAVVTASKTPLTNLTALLSGTNLCLGPVQAPVVNKTGLEGLFDFKVTWKPCRGDTTPGSDGTVPYALKEQLGLKLESAMVPEEFFVIDNAEKPSGEAEAYSLAPISRALKAEQNSTQPSTVQSTLKFEVASIKPSQSPAIPSGMGVGRVGPGTGPVGCHGTDRGPQAIPLGRCIFRNVTAGFLISTISILDGKEYQLGQLPGWVTSQGFDIEGKADHPVTQMELGAMLKALLIDRFKCTFHTETRQVSGFSLVVAPKGSKLEKAADQNPQDPKDQNTSIAILDEVTGKQGAFEVLSPLRTALLVSTKTSMPWLATFISRFGIGPVVDRTELGGFYAFRMRWQPEGNLSTESIDRIGPSLTTAFEEQLGLRLQSQKVPVEYLLIDHIEMPVPN